jgi:hypothetical protein
VTAETRRGQTSDELESAEKLHQALYRSPTPDSWAPLEPKDEGHLTWEDEVNGYVDVPPLTTSIWTPTAPVQTATVIAAKPAPAVEQATVTPVALGENQVELTQQQLAEKWQSDFWFCYNQQLQQAAAAAIAREAPSPPPPIERPPRLQRPWEYPECQHGPPPPRYQAPEQESATAKPITEQVKLLAGLWWFLAKSIAWELNRALVVNFPTFGHICQRIYRTAEVSIDFVRGRDWTVETTLPFSPFRNPDDNVLIDGIIFPPREKWQSMYRGVRLGDLD